jgi:hypothetical protein
MPEAGRRSLMVRDGIAGLTGPSVTIANTEQRIAKGMLNRVVARTRVSGIAA